MTEKLTVVDPEGLRVGDTAIVGVDRQRVRVKAINGHEVEVAVITPRGEYLAQNTGTNRKQRRAK